MKSKNEISGSDASSLVICDWGSSHLRVFHVDHDGRILGKYESEEGVKSMAGDSSRYNGALAAAIGELQVGSEIEIRISGMAGSKLGWKETDYSVAPVSAHDFSSNFLPLENFTDARLFGGVMHEDKDGSVDVMRGEEVQVFGVLELYPDATKICLPGTHSKWVTVEDGQIVSFKTYMTGDLFHALCEESIFKTQIASREFDKESFLAGCRLAEEGNDLQDLFKLRSEFVFSQVSGEGFYSYLSGFLISNELQSAKPDCLVYLCGSASLTPMYALALEQIGIETLVIDSETATIRGHLALSSS